MDKNIFRLVDLEFFREFFYDRPNIDGNGYAYHFSHDRDQVYLPCSLVGTGNACHIFKIENSLPAKHVNFRSNLIQGNERVLQKMDFKF